MVGWTDHWYELARSGADRPTRSCPSARPPWSTGVLGGEKRDEFTVRGEKKWQAS